MLCCAEQDVGFILDIVINFRTGYWDDGTLVMSACTIATRYIKSGWFFFDLIATIPYDRITVKHGPRAALLLRLLRLLRLQYLTTCLLLSHCRLQCLGPTEAPSSCGCRVFCDSFYLDDIYPTLRRPMP